MHLPRRTLPTILIATLAAALVGCGSAESLSHLRADWQRGMNFTGFEPLAYSSAPGNDALRALRATGTRYVALDPYWYMRDAGDSAVAPDPGRTASDSSLLDAMRRARSLGMVVMMKPHVDVASGAFRGTIAPRSPAAWFASYTQMIDHYAELARAGGAGIFVVGTELTSLTGYTDAWRRLIADVRGRFRGSLTFAANWDAGAALVRFWDALDMIGIDAYMPLRAPGREPSVAALEAAWRPYVGSISALQRRERRPVLFTELGYQSRAGTARTPYLSTGRADQVAQARAYEAAFRVWSRPLWFRGIYWWDWSAAPLHATSTDASFHPRAKLAEGVLRHWYGAAYR